MPSKPPTTRRYSIEIKDVDDKSVLFTAADWTDEEARLAVAQNHEASRPARRQLPDPAGAKAW